MTDTMLAPTDAYLRRLRRAARWLPASQADELYEQVTSHLADALPADAGADEVARVLAELGAPEVLVREAAGDRKRRLGIRLRRVRWTTWVICGLLLAGLVASLALVAAHLVPEYTAAGLDCGCGEDIAYTDGAPTKDIHDGSFDAIQLDARPGRQGIEFDLDNRTSVSQRVLGFPPGGGPWGGQPSVVYTLQVGTRDTHGFPLTSTRFTTVPVTIPPGQDRDVRLEWKNLECTHLPRRTLTLTGVQLRVKIGPFTRTESVDLPSAIILRSTKAC